MKTLDCTTVGTSFPKAGETCFLGDMYHVRDLKVDLLQVQHSNGCWGIIIENPQRKNSKDSLGVLVTDLMYASIGERYEAGECHDIIIFGMIKKQSSDIQGFHEGDDSARFEQFDVGVYFPSRKEKDFKIYTIPELQIENANIYFQYIPSQKETGFGHMHVLLKKESIIQTVVFDCFDGKVLSSLKY